MEWSTPKSKKDLQRFLGFCNYYRRFYQGYANLIAPFSNLLQAKSSFLWTQEHEDAFRKLKEAFANPTVLANPVYDGRSLLIACRPAEEPTHSLI
jgi:hypothetical protein